MKEIIKWQKFVVPGSHHKLWIKTLFIIDRPATVVFRNFDPLFPLPMSISNKKSENHGLWPQMNLRTTRFSFCFVLVNDGLTSEIHDKYLDRGGSGSRILTVRLLTQFPPNIQFLGPPPKSSIGYYFNTGLAVNFGGPPPKVVSDTTSIFCSWGPPPPRKKYPTPTQKRHFDIPL